MIRYTPEMEQMLRLQGQLAVIAFELAGARPERRLELEQSRRCLEQDLDQLLRGQAQDPWRWERRHT